MAYLELAEGYGGVTRYQGMNGFTRYMAENNPTELYVFVPDDPTGETGQWVREDYFDNLPDGEWEMVMDALADFQPDQMSGIFSNIRENIQERRERRAERKDAKQEAKMQRIENRSQGIFGGKLKNLVGSLIPDVGGAQAGMMPQQGMPMTRDPQFSFDFQAGQQQSFFDRNKAWIIPVGAGVVIGGIYLATRKKKR
jgi:hypothetical protein